MQVSPRGVIGYPALGIGNQPMLLTMLVLCAIFMGSVLGVFWALLRRPPVIHVEMPPVEVIIDLTPLIPTPLVLQVQTVPPDQQPKGLPEEPMPQVVFAYCGQESEEHARVSRMRHARHLRNELGSWDAALERLKNEDA